MLQGLCVFGLNFICFYTAVKYVNSGLESVIFSMAVFFNAINALIFLSETFPKLCTSCTFGPKWYCFTVLA